MLIEVIKHQHYAFCRSAGTKFLFNIHEDLTLSDIEMQHVLHPNRADISIPPEIKDFISDNISLLPREIYIQLVERGLNGKNRSTFAWTELSKKDITEMTLISAQKWKCSWI
ncbi:unnamed protein product [Rhizophagus irregularis]|nr:unnamed protein product [Rhizophagus irregularis]